MAMETKVKDSAKKPSSRLLMIVVLLTVVVVIIASLAVVFTQPLCTARLVLKNRSAYYDVKVGIYLDGKLKEILQITHGKSYVHVFKLTRGNHTIGFDFSYNAYYGADIDGVVDRLYSFQVWLLTPATLGYNLSP
jgi:hypothetical protein